jgi:hypothetical protein
MLQNQRMPVIKKKGVRCILVCPQHDNTQPHAARHTVREIQDLKLEVLAHLPYSPDSAPSDFHPF